MRVLSLFSGIGAFEKALDKLGVGYELVNYCEIDKNASKAYSLIHNVSEDKNLKDVTTVNTNKLKDIDLVTYGFPCQDISLAGNQKGFVDEKGNRTRSGLFFEALRIIDKTRPKIAIAENVKGLTGAKFDNEFKIVLGNLNKLGYNNYFKVLNAKDYGIPQSRERVFIISIRQDIDKGFTFPSGIKLLRNLGDVLESYVDCKYYLDDKRISAIYKTIERNKLNGNGFGARFMSPNGLSNTILTHPDKTRGLYLKLNEEIRKLTPKECFRLMGFTDRDIDILIDNGISDAQLYKMAGNSIVVDVIYYIFKELKAIYPDLFVISKKSGNQVSINDILKEA